MGGMHHVTIMLLYMQKKLRAIYNDFKENWKHLKYVILEAGYQHFLMCVVNINVLVCNCSFDEECKRDLKFINLVKGESERHGMAPI